MEKDDLKLKFDGYEIQKIYLDRDNDSVSSEEEIGFLFKMVPEKEKGFERVNIIEGVRIESSDEFGYKLEVIIKGKFRVLNCEEDSEKYKLLRTNASAILFPYLRALVGMVSSQTEYENIVLPVMNFDNLFKQQKLEDLLLDYKEFEEF